MMVSVAVSKTFEG